MTTRPSDERKTLWEVEVIFSSDSKEVHLVLATGQEEALLSFFRRRITYDKPVAAYRAVECSRYKSVILGHRSYL